MPSLFRIDRNSITADKGRPADVVVLPGFEDMIGRKLAQVEEEPEIEEKESEEDLLLKEKLAQIDKLEQEIEQAQDRAKNIIVQANKDAQKLADEAVQKGYEEGYAKAIASVNEEKRRLSQSMEESLVALMKAKDEVFEQVEDSVLDLALFIAERVVKTELDKNNEVFLNILRNTLSKVKYQSNIIVKVSKNEFENIFADGGEAIRSEMKNSGVEIKQDLSLSKGECIVETEYGNINSSVKTQLERLTAALKEGSAENA